MLLQDGEFKIYFVPVVYKVIIASEGSYIRNKISGANCGHRVSLYKTFYDECGELLKSPHLDEDVYEVVCDENND